MVGDDRQERIDSGPRDAAAGLAYAILFIACQVGAVYLSARWLMGLGRHRRRRGTHGTGAVGLARRGDPAIA